ncbi:MAG: hypothetical protein R3B90_17535 [Planctomycetaceae bacterium]
MSRRDEPMKFKFHFLNEQGQPQSVFRKQGTFDGETLKLDDLDVPAAVILQTVVRDNRIVLAVLTNDGAATHLLIALGVEEGGRPAQTQARHRPQRYLGEAASTVIGEAGQGSGLSRRGVSALHGHRGAHGHARLAAALLSLLRHALDGRRQRFPCRR